MEFRIYPRHTKIKGRPGGIIYSPIKPYIRNWKLLELVISQSLILFPFPKPPPPQVDLMVLSIF